MTKYRAIKTVVDNITFASKREAVRYSELKILEKCGMIDGLILQPKFALYVTGTKVADYIADFAYWDKDMKRRVIEDSKGFKTPVYRLKKKLFEACYPELRITEV